MRPLKLVTVSAGLSVPSSTRLLADRLARSVSDQLTAQQLAFTAEVVELRDHARAIADHLVTGFPGPALNPALATVAAADGLIVVTPVFAASYSGLFKGFFDVLERDSLRGTPVLIAATGGTPRHSLVLEHAMRPLFAYLGSVVAPSAVYAATSDWGAAGHAESEQLARRFDRAGAELAALMNAHGQADRPADAYEEPVPFEQQLAAVRGDGR